MIPATIIEALAMRAADTPDTRAFVIEGETATYRQVYDDAVWVARRLSRAGLRPGCRCLVMLPSGLDFVRTVYALQLLRAAPIAADPALTAAARDLRIALVQPTVIVTTSALAGSLGSGGPGSTGPAILTPETLASLPPDRESALALPGPEDTAYLQFTSGTSGSPRACVVSHRALMAALAGMEDRYDLTSRDVLANWLPLHYSSGLVRHVFGTVYHGCPSFLVSPSAAGLSRWLALISDVRATVTTSPNFAYRLVCQMVAPSDVDLRSLRIALNGGEAVRASTITSFESRFGLSRVVQPAYGLTEGTLAVASCGQGDELLVDQGGNVSCGRAISGAEIRVVDATGAECPVGAEGEIQIRGNVLFSGYFGDEPGTSAVFHDGWFQPGDVGCIDAEGRVFLRSRARAMIKRGGVGVSPREIEDPVEQLPGVVGAAAIGVARPGGVTEDLLVIIEVLERDKDRAGELALAAERIAVAAVGLLPRSVLVVPAATIPRTSSGKVRHAALRDLATSPAFLHGAYFVG